ncbi:MAG: RNA-directed DNA polymerase [Mariprofundaceae bacterium]|nr:RNA-directed DNA polymerase [Mariprofundaceae bacterium]
MVCSALEMLARRIECPRLLQVFADLLDSFHTDAKFDSLFPSEHPYLECHDKGLPLGNLTSQILANIYLDPFDHWIKDELGWRYYVRYVDDMVFWHSDHQALLELLSAIEDHLRKQVGLLLRPNKTALLSKQQGIDFLGYRIYPSHCLPRKKNQRKVRRLLRVGMSSGERASWNGYFSHSSAATLWTTRLDFNGF